MINLNSDQLHAGITVLANDVVDAVVHWKLSRGILEASKSWPLVIQQSNTFWLLTIKAHVDVSVLAMCRVFDQQNTSLHLLVLLQLIEENLSLFEVSNFRERLRDNPFVASLSESARVPDAKQLENDISLCSLNDPLVKLLMKHRNNNVAHLGRKTHLNRINPNIDDEITNADFEMLLTRAVEIINRYSNLFGAEYYSTQMVGHEDYKTIFRWIQERVVQERQNLNI